MIKLNPFVISKTTVENYAYDSDTSLEKVKIASSVTKIGQGAFLGCKNLKEVIFEERTDPIEFEKNTFYGCSRLEQIKFPEGIEILSNGMFTSTSLSKVFLPSSIKSVGSAFWLCDELEVHYNGTMEKWNEIAKDADLGSMKRRKIICTDGILGELKSLNPAAKWFSFEGDALDYCSPKATGVITVPDYVTEIFDEAFAGCKKITEIQIPCSIKKLGRELFKDCNEVDVYYNGTEEEWNEIEKGEDCIQNCNRFLICSLIKGEKYVH